MAPEGDRTCQGFLIVTDESLSFADRIDMQNNLMWDQALGRDGIDICSSQVTSRSPCSTNDPLSDCRYTCYDVASFDGDFIPDGGVDLKDVAQNDLYRLVSFVLLPSCRMYSFHT